MEDSIADHAAYLLGAKNGSKPRYEGIKGNIDYKQVAQLIKEGGYATSATYVEKLCKLIEKWNLTQYDVKAPKEPEKTPETVNEFPATPFLTKVIIDDLNYRSEPCMGNNVKGQTGVGTFTIVEVRDGWGKLKSGAGWIWLKNSSYCVILGAAKKKQEDRKSIEQLAKEVIKGAWGNGEERRRRLTAAGYDYEKVQSKVNEMLS